MLKDAKGIKDRARVAKNSSARAYAGHASEFRHVLGMAELNLTEYARSFGIYKAVHETMSKSNLPKKVSSKKSVLGKREREKSEKAKSEDKRGEGTELFTRRLQKSKLKDLELKMRATQYGDKESYKIKDLMDKVKKAVFTDERKLEQRKAGFERAKNRLNIKKTVLSEFM